MNTHTYTHMECLTHFKVYFNDGKKGEIKSWKKAVEMITHHHVHNRTIYLRLRHTVRENNPLTESSSFFTFLYLSSTPFCLREKFPFLYLFLLLKFVCVTFCHFSSIRSLDFSLCPSSLSTLLIVTQNLIFFSLLN